jgi:hypothetical protein
MARQLIPGVAVAVVKAGTAVRVPSHVGKRLDEAAKAEGISRSVDVRATAIALTGDPHGVCQRVADVGGDRPGGNLSGRVLTR